MLIDDIVAALVAGGYGQTTDEKSDWRIRALYLQANPDRSICVYPAGGAPPETGMSVGYPTIQIRVRGAEDDAQAVMQKEQDIFTFLQAGNAPIQLGTGYVYCYAIQSAPIPMGQDENRRPSVVRNYRLMKTPA